jgi:hypothetical protein
LIARGYGRQMIAAISASPEAEAAAQQQICELQQVL